MADLFLVLLPIALVDSISVTPIGLVPLIHILSGRRPQSAAMGLLSGLFLSYLIMALAFLFGLSAVLGKANTWLSHRWKNPEPMDFAVEILIGLVLLAFGWPIAAKRKAKSEEKSKEKKLPEKPSFGSAFGFGFMINVVGFPGAVPYFAAADQITRANLPASSMVMAVAFYCALFILPLTLLVLMHGMLGARLDGFMQGCRRFFETTGVTIMKVAMILLGLVLIADGVAYFFWQPLIPIGYPGPG